MQVREQSGAHQFAETLLNDFGAVNLPAELTEAALDIARAQTLQARHLHPVEVIEWPRLHYHRHGHMGVVRRIGRAGGLDLHIVVATRFEIGLEPPRDVGEARIGIRRVGQVDHLCPQRFRPVNRVAGKMDVAKEILTPFFDRHRHVDVSAVV